MCSCETGKAFPTVNCCSSRGQNSVLLFALQVMGKVPTISINKTDGCHVYLSKNSLDCEIVSAKSSEMNVLIPTEGGDFVSFLIPLVVWCENRRAWRLVLEKASWWTFCTKWGPTQLCIPQAHESLRWSHRIDPLRRVVSGLGWADAQGSRKDWGWVTAPCWAIHIPICTSHA